MAKSKARLYDRLLEYAAKRYDLTEGNMFSFDELAEMLKTKKGWIRRAVEKLENDEIEITYDKENVIIPAYDRDWLEHFKDTSDRISDERGVRNEAIDYMIIEDPDNELGHNPDKIAEEISSDKRQLSGDDVICAIGKLIYNGKVIQEDGFIRLNKKDVDIDSLL